jgi:ribosomal protein L12E/L44/L45/RPP1/RPP2
MPRRTGQCTKAGSTHWTGTIADELEEEVARTLISDLCGVDPREAIVVTRVPGDSLADWSRDCRAWTLQLRATGSGRTFTLLMSARRFEMLTPARAVLPSAALVTRREAVGGNSLSLSAVVGEVEMSVSELADVSIDDVLVLDQHLADPIALLASHSHIPVAAGNLGRAGARRAIKITSIAASRN